MSRFTYDTTDCRRCGGSGEYSWNAMTGSRCFRCNGRGVELSRAAVKSKETVEKWHRETASVRVDELTEGQLIRFKLGEKLRPVESIKRENTRAASIKPDGTRVPLWELTVRGSSTIHMREPDSTVIRQLTEAEQRERDELLRSLPGVTEHDD